MLQSIQYLRGYAALAVSVFHLLPMFIPTNDNSNPISFGAAGVDVFFVISGFIMWHIAQGKQQTPSDFLMHRIIRVVPLYWMVTLVLALCAFLKPNLFPLDHPTPEHVVSSMLFVPHGEGMRGRPLISQGWTLNYEMSFYLVFAVMLLLNVRFRLIAITAIFICLTTIGLITHPSTPLPTLAFSPLFLEFLAGIYIAIAFERKILLPRPFAIVTLLFSVVMLYVELDWLRDRAFFWGIPAALIVWSMVSLEAMRSFHKNRILLSFGAASYSIYLVHFLAATFYQIGAAKLGLPVHGPIAYALGLICAIACGFACHLLIEKRMERVLKPLIERRKPPLHSSSLG